ncbi:hypothetical protein K438DRAFT_1992197 [Mycena galopus ATCC 62051]|nr:hypothetical protein K438DRAFT_1992197 [Mycena galopus ATCC 62051]
MDGSLVKTLTMARAGFANIDSGVILGPSVAGKVMRVLEDSDIEAVRKEFCQEALIWGQPSHPNLLPFMYYPIEHGLSFRDVLVSFEDFVNLYPVPPFSVCSHVHLRELYSRFPSCGRLFGINVHETSGRLRFLDSSFYEPTLRGTHT